MSLNSNKKEIIIYCVLLFVKCFLILLLFGVIIPTILDITLTYYLNNTVKGNSVFVNKLFSKNTQLINHYINLFRIFIGY